MKSPVFVSIVLLRLTCSFFTVDAFNDPHFQAFQIVEESPNGTEVAGVSEYLQRSVGIGVRATYQLLDSHELLTRLLKIEPKSGRLYIGGRVDRESLCSQSSSLGLGYREPDTICIKHIHILASIQHEGQREISVQPIPLKLAIQDVNDNAPSWDGVTRLQDGRPLLETRILEQDPNNKVLVPAAHDPDTGLNGEISYRLENYRANSEDEELSYSPVPFKISGPVNGFLQLTPFHPIDYEKCSVYELDLVATDGGKPSQVGSAHLRVNVIDVNDEAPVFTQRIFTAAGGQGISERTQLGEVILNVTAFDKDASERNSRLTYSMVPGSERLIGEIFSVHPDGRIILRDWLDYESLEPARMASSEAAAREAPPSNRKQFAFYVKATDSAPPPYEKTGTALVVIPIIDENDERPVISSRFLDQSLLGGPGEAGLITENSSVPVRLAYIQARDPDFGGRDRVECWVPDNDNLSLERINQTTHQQFGMDDSATGGGSGFPNSNDFVLSLEAPVDHEVTKMLSVRIHCVDDANNTANQIINLRVLDVNDEAPSFGRPVIYFTVSENIKAPPVVSNENGTYGGYRIGRVIAEDKDQGDNAKVHYSLLPQMEIEEPKGRPSIFSSIDNVQVGTPVQTSDYFRIDTLTGELFALKSFDAEREKIIRFHVIAVDQPTSGLSHTGTSNVQVNIGDMNDWSPVFHRVLEDEVPRRHQTFIQPSIMDGLTSVDSYHFSIKENMPAYSLVGRVGAIDPDVSFWTTPYSEFNAASTTSTDTARTPPLPGVRFQFASGTPQHVENAFNIHATSGQIRTARPLDREAFSNYTFNVIAVDKGPRDQVSRTSTAAVTVIVEDENDNDPVFIRPTKQPVKSGGTTQTKDDTSSQSSPLDLAESSGDNDPIPYVTVSIPGGGSSDTGNVGPMNRPLIRVEAQDPDEGPNGQIRFEIKSGNTDDLFYLDAVTGSLLLKATHPSAKDASSYLLKIEACDQGTPRRCAIPTRLKIVMEKPGGKAGIHDGLPYPAYQDSGQYPSSGRYSNGPTDGTPKGGGNANYADQWHGGNYGDHASQWVSQRSKWDEKQRYLWNDYERQGGVYRRSGVSVSEAVIICVAVIFVVFLIAALILFYVVKRKSIYLAIGGRQKQKDTEEPNCPEYAPDNYKHETSITCESMEPNEKASIYRMLPCTQAPGKIVFVGNNFDGQSLSGAPVPDAGALSPITHGKRSAPSLQEYSLRRGMSASAAVLTNHESVYITGPGGRSEASAGAIEYPEVVTRSAFNYPQPMYRDDSLQPTAEISQVMLGTLVGPNGTTQAVNIAASPQQPSEYDTVTFQRRCASLKPNYGAAPTPHTYRYIQPPYIYTPVVGSPQERIVHCRGLSDPANNATTPFSPHHRHPYVFAEDAHTYHGLDILSNTLQRQQKRPHGEELVEVAPPPAPTVASSPYGRLRAPMSSYAIAASTNRYAVLNARMAPDGEVTSLMEPSSTLRRGVRGPHAQQMTQLVRLKTVGTLEEGDSEDFDDQKSSPNSLSEAFEFDEVLVMEDENEEDQESITDPNAKLISSEHNGSGDHKLAGRIQQLDGQSSGKHPSHPPESDSQATTAINTEAAYPSSSNGTDSTTPQQGPTYAVHEASFV